MTDAWNRREALGALATAGTLAILPQAAQDAQAGHVEVGRQTHRDGVHGKMTAAQAAAASLCCLGTPCVFGIPGAQNNELWDAFKAHGLPYLLVTHESSASVMADASARVTGRSGVCCVVPGPGLTNALTGLGEALLDSVPVIALVTDIDRAPLAPIGQVHSLPTLDLVRPVSKAVLLVRHPSEVPGAIFQANALALSGEPGPVAVVIPFTILTQAWDYDLPTPPPPPVPFDEGGYQAALRVLSDRSKRVGLYVGLGCMDVGPVLMAAAEIMQAPVATSVSGKGAVPDGHPLAVGWGYGKQGTRAAERAFEDVDIVLAVGVKYSEVSTANYAIPQQHTIVHVDANPRNLGRNVHTCVKLCADSRVFFERLVADAAQVRRAPDARQCRHIQAGRAADANAVNSIQTAEKVDPMFFLGRLRCATGPDDLFFIDVTASTHWAAESIKVEAPRRYFAPANNQSMGWAIPAAIGGQRVCLDRRVVSISGDGCFLMSAIEMSTAARAGLPVKFFVLDDGVYHYMQMFQEPAYRRTTATDLARIDYAAFAQSVGIGFNQIACNADIDAGVARALAYPGPILTQVLISYDGRELRWLSALKKHYLASMPGDQKRRLAARVVVRSLQRGDDSD